MALVAILFYRIRPKIVIDAIFGINLLCTFSEVMLINKLDMKHFVKHEKRTDKQMHGWTEGVLLSPTPYLSGSRR